MEVQELQVLRTVFAFSLHRCSLEGMYFRLIPKYKNPVLWKLCIFVFSPNIRIPHSTHPLFCFCFLCCRSGSWTGGDGAWVELSGKMHVLARLLAHLRKKTDDRIVLVSNYTQVMILEYIFSASCFFWSAGNICFSTNNSSMASVSTIFLLLLYYVIAN